jgi:hypothetical protein
MTKKPGQKWDTKKNTNKNPKEEQSKERGRKTETS